MLIVISFDSVGDKVFESMAANPELYPNVSAFGQRNFYRGNVETVFISNTYPIHTSVATGKFPAEHGIRQNVLKTTKQGKHWAQEASLIKAKTIWDAAKEKKLSVASFLWPVTCGAKIKYHVPETHILKGQNQIMQNLKHGSKFFQLKAFLKHRNRLNGIEQPYLDDFTTNVAYDTILKKKPDLALIHLTAYDSIFHIYGSQGEAIEIAKKSLDNNLGLLLKANRKGTVVLFSDHNQFDINETINLKVLYDAEFLQSGGCAFGNKASLDMVDQYWFGRYLTKEEMEESGYAGKYAFGLAPKPGFTFGEDYNLRGDHGYPTDYPDYRVFYSVSRSDLHYKNYLKGHIFDVTAIIAKELGLDMDILNDYELR